MCLLFSTHYHYYCIKINTREIKQSTKVYEVGGVGEKKTLSGCVSKMQPFYMLNTILFTGHTNAGRSSSGGGSNLSIGTRYSPTFLLPGSMLLLGRVGSQKQENVQGWRNKDSNGNP